MRYDILRKFLGINSKSRNRPYRRDRVQLRLELLEDRLTPAPVNLVATSYVNDNWAFVNDTDNSGTLSYLDEIRNTNDTINPNTITAFYGLNGFGTVTTGAITGSFASYDNITDAIARTIDGGTVKVLEGTFEENVFVGKGVFLVGAQAGVDARGRTATESTIQSPDGGVAFTLSADDISLDGFHVVDGVLQATGSDLSIVNNLFSVNAGLNQALVGAEASVIGLSTIGGTVTVSQNSITITGSVGGANYTQTVLYGQDGWSGGAQPDFTNDDTGVDNLDGTFGDEKVTDADANTGNQSWRYSRGYNSPGQGTPYSPALADAVDTDGEVFYATVWIKPVSSTPDNSEIAIETGTTDGTDRGNYLAFVKHQAGGLRIYSLTNGSAFDEIELFSGVSADSWHRLDFTLTKNGFVDTVTVALDGGTPVSYAAALNEYRQDNSNPYADSSRLKFRTRHTDGDVSFKGFYLDDISVQVGSESYRTGFENGPADVNGVTLGGDETALTALNIFNNDVNGGNSDSSDSSAVLIAATTFGGIVTISGNDLTGFNGGVRVATGNTAVITDNSSSIHGNDIGIDVNGIDAYATITGNHIYDNDIGIRFTNGGSGSVGDTLEAEGNNFFGGEGFVNNDTDLSITSTAGTVTIGAFNHFAGDTFYIDVQSTQSFDLTSNDTIFEETDNFRIEDKMHHRMDTDLVVTVGLVTWEAGNAYVTDAGTDHSIQRGVDAVPDGYTVNAEAGTYNVDQIRITHAVNVVGAGALTSIIDGGNVTTLPDAGMVTIRADGANVTFSGFILQNAGKDGSGGTEVAIFAKDSVGGGAYVISHNEIIGNSSTTAEIGIWAYRHRGTLDIDSNTISTMFGNNILLESQFGASRVHDNILTAGNGSSAYFNMTYDGDNITTLQRFDHNTVTATNGSGVTFNSAFLGSTGTFSSVEVSDNTFTAVGTSRRAISLVNGVASGVGTLGNISGASIVRNSIEGTDLAGSVGIRTVGLVTGAQITNNFIKDVESAFLGALGTGSDPANVGTDIVLTGNSFVSSTNGVNWAGVPLLNASGNWWGSISGPTVASNVAATGAAIIGAGSANVDYTPWLNFSTDFDVPSLGFQGDFSSLTVNAGSPQTGSVKIIQEGINLLEDGSLTGNARIVNVKDGSYAGGILIDKTATVSGTGLPTVTAADLSGQPVAFQIGADDVILDGFDITGTDTDYGVLFSDKSTGSPFTGGTVQNSEFSGLGYAIATADGAVDYTNANILDNMITVTTGWGIYLQSGSGHEVYGNTITGTGTGAGFLVQNTDDVTIGGTGTDEGNTISNLASAVIAVDATDTSFVGNTVTGMSGVSGAVRLEGGVAGFNITQNSITGGLVPAVLVRDPGFSASSPAYNGAIVVNNNILTGNTIGIRVADTSLIDTLDARFNKISGNTTANVTNDSAQIVDVSGSYLGANLAAITPTITGTGTVDYTPFLNSGTDSDLVAPGFQGDFSQLTVHTAGVQNGSTGRIQEGVNLLADGTLTGGARILHVLAGTYTDGGIDASAKALTLAAGSSPGKVTINPGNFILSSDDTLDIDVTGYTAGTGYDQFVVNGNVTLGGAALVIHDSLGNPITLGSNLTIIDKTSSGAVSGVFTITYPAGPGGSGFVVNGHTYQISYAAGSGNDVVLSLGLPAGDNFNRPNSATLGAAWTNQNGGFAIASEMAVAQGNLNNVATLNGITVADVSVQADAIFTAVGQYVSLVARYSGTGDTNMYVGLLRKSSATQMRASIYRNISGVWVELFARMINTNANTRAVRFDVVGTSLKLFVNGTLAAYAQDATFTTGLIGIRAGMGGKVDNYLGSPLSQVQATLPFTDNFTSPSFGSQLSNQWLDRNGNTTIVGGLAVGQDTMVPNVATLNGVNVANVTLQAVASFTAVGQYVSLVGRYSGAGDTNMYAGLLKKTSATQMNLVIYKNVAGVWTELIGQTINGTGGLLKFVLAGDLLTLSLGANVISKNDSSFTTGAIGIRTSAGGRLGTFSAS